MTPTIVSSRALQIGSTIAPAVAGVTAGGIGSAALVRGAHRHDRLADRNQVVERRDGMVVERTRPDLGPLSMLGSIVIGGGVAGGTAAWGFTSTAPANTGAALLRRAGAGTAFAVGIGIVAGGIGAAMQYQNTTFRPE